MKKLSLVSAILGLMSASANARETVLVCTIGRDNYPNYVTVDFDNSIVTTALGNSSSAGFRATITPERIEWYVPNIVANVRYVINRIDGKLYSYPEGSKTYYSASCKTVPTPPAIR
jgi:hypothetical protein